MMKTRVRKWGNSLAVRIPAAFASELGLEPDNPVEISLQHGQLVVERVAEDYTLEYLLAQVNENDLHGETDTGAPVGNEAW
jgi:antitoxin MazE